jgi:DNA-binding NarL/FixJ family response regulator
MNEWDGSLSAETPLTDLSRADRNGAQHLCVAGAEPKALAPLRAALGAVRGLYFEEWGSEACRRRAAARETENSVSIVFAHCAGGPLRSLSDICEVSRAHPRGRVVVLAVEPDASAVLAFLGAGALSVLIQPAAPDYLRKSVIAAMEDKAVLCPGTQALLVKHFQTVAQGGCLPDLSPREQQVVSSLACGASSKEIAQRLQVAEPTVHAHIAKAYEKLGVHTRGQALRRYWDAIRDIATRPAV